MSSAVSPAPAKLYSPRLLMLSARLADYPLTGAFALTATARSRTCGSVIEIGLDPDNSGAVSRIGMMVTACAVGQSSAAIVAGGIVGQSAATMAATVTTIERWLEGEGDPPDWPEFNALLPALEHRGRHGALLLPWNAALEALSSDAASS
jgi:NifU-like protein involved in Fe-S cluster formation